MRAGPSQRHVSFLETGRSNPSRFAISQLAEALKMPAAEVDAMFLSAGFAARSTRERWDDATLGAIEASIDHILQSHAPYPAVLIDRIWTVLRANEPAQAFLTKIGGTGGPNLLREFLTPGPVRDSIRNWDETARGLMRLFELEVARRPHDREAKAMHAELLQIPGVGPLMSLVGTNRSAPVLTIQFLIDDAELELFSLIATIGMSAEAALDDLRIETLLPANDATRAWFLAHTLHLHAARDQTLS